MPSNVSFGFDLTGTYSDPFAYRGRAPYGWFVPICPPYRLLLEFTPVADGAKPDCADSSNDGTAESEELTPVEDAAKPDWEALAIGTQVKYPEWSVAKIAKRVGVHRTTLYASETFMLYRQTMKQLAKEGFLDRLPRGRKEVARGDQGAAPRLEAWRDQDDAENDDAAEG
jgi:hypothetical protein